MAASVIEFVHLAAATVAGLCTTSAWSSAPGTSWVHHVHQLIHVVPYHVRHRGPHCEQPLPIASNYRHGNLAGVSFAKVFVQLLLLMHPLHSYQGGPESNCLLPELRLVHRHHPNASAVLVATSLGLLHVAHLDTHSDGSAFSK